MPTPLASLPQALVRSIFTYVFVPDYHRGLDSARLAVPPELLSLALVCREWNVYAQDLFSEVLLSKLTLKEPSTFAGRTRSKLLDLRRRFTLVHAYLRELVIKEPGYSREDARLFTVDEWQSILSHAPRLERLDMKYSRRKNTKFLTDVACAARRSCPAINTLRFPGASGFMINEASDRSEELIDAVLGDTSMPPATKNVKLSDLHELHLPVPFIKCQNPHASATNYLTRICDVCPTIDVFDGFSGVFDQNDRLVCDELWYIDAATWERFCATCVNLKSFDWVVAPFTTWFFDIFGRYPKPQIKTLVFSTAMNWNWDRYLSGLSQPRPQRGYGPTAVNAHLALQACPNLKCLEVATYFPGDADEDEDEFEFGMFAAHRQQRPRVPETLLLNQEIFGDEFFEAVAAHCRELEKLTVWRVVQSSNNNAIMSFTDRAMRAIASLPRLYWAGLKSTNFTGDGLFQLAAMFARDTEYTKRQREFEITIGDVEGTATDMLFYTVVEQFLERLVQTTPADLVCADRKVALRLHNGRFQRVDRVFAAQYLVRVRALAKQALQIHPTVRLRVLTRGYRMSAGSVPDSCDDVCEFGFYTETIMCNGWWGWENEPQDTRIDDVVLNRGPMATPHNQRRDGEEEGDDDESGDDY